MSSLIYCLCPWSWRGSGREEEVGRNLILEDLGQRMVEVLDWISEGRSSVNLESLDTAVGHLLIFWLHAISTRWYVGCSVPTYRRLLGWWSGVIRRAMQTCRWLLTTQGARHGIDGIEDILVLDETIDDSLF
jgi:hypothetical protein